MNFPILDMSQFLSNLHHFYHNFSIKIQILSTLSILSMQIQFSKQVRE